MESFTLTELKMKLPNTRRTIRRRFSKSLKHMHGPMRQRQGESSLGARHPQRADMPHRRQTRTNGEQNCGDATLWTLDRTPRKAEWAVRSTSSPDNQCPNTHHKRSLQREVPSKLCEVRRAPDVLGDAVILLHMEIAKGKYHFLQLPKLSFRGQDHGCILKRPKGRNDA